MNATAKHTPGPWTAVPDPIERGSLMVVGSDFPAMGVVTCINVYRHNEAGESDSDANARLIAAAPTLLAACEAALPWLSLLGDFIGNGVAEDKHNHGTPVGPMGRCDAMLALNDAVRAARGA